MSPGAATKLVATVFGVSMVIAVGMLIVDLTPLSVPEVAGVRKGFIHTDLIPAATGSATVSVSIFLDGRFTVQHPLGPADGRVVLEGSTVTLKFERINKMSIYEWVDKGWIARRLEMVRHIRQNRAKTPVPRTTLTHILDAKDVAAADRILGLDTPIESLDPFGPAWTYRVSRRGEWTPLRAEHPYLQ